MSLLAVTSISLALAFFAPPAASQQATNPPPSHLASSQSAGANAAMTPRQTEEMRADFLVAKKEYGDAISIYQKLLHAQPKDAGLLNKVGLAYQQQGMYVHAAQFYKRATKADSSFASAWNNLGTVEYERKHFRKAIRLYDKALALRSDMASIYSNLGYACLADKQYPAAMNAFEKALSLDPTVFERKGGVGITVQQRSMTDPGMFYFYVAKSYALAGNAERCAHYLTMARDEGYKDFASAQTDPAFSRVVKDPRVQEVLQPPKTTPQAPQKPA
jgi:tetratricopeptide (TPR) repeat protein